MSTDLSCEWGTASVFAFLTSLLVWLPLKMVWFGLMHSTESTDPRIISVFYRRCTRIISTRMLLYIFDLLRNTMESTKNKQKKNFDRFLWTLFQFIRKTMQCVFEHFHRVEFGREQQKRATTKVCSFVEPKPKQICINHKLCGAPRCGSVCASRRH